MDVRFSVVMRLWKSTCPLTVYRTFVSKSADFNKNSSSVDMTEVIHHEKLSSNWWDVDKGPVRVLHAMNSVRVPFIRTGLVNAQQLDDKIANSKPDYLRGISIIDIGCGGGILSVALARLGATVVGVEPGTSLASEATAAIKREGLGEQAKIIESTIEEHAEKNKEFYDAVVLSEVIEHVSNKDIFITKCLEVLKPGGSIFFTTINRTTVAWALAVIAGENILGLIPKGTHQYEKFITPEELSDLLSQKNCTTKMVSGYMYKPLTNKFYWQSSTGVFYSLHGVKNK